SNNPTPAGAGPDRGAAKARDPCGQGRSAASLLPDHTARDCRRARRNPAARGARPAGQARLARRGVVMTSLYRALLHLYPSSFRNEYGDEMTHVFAETCARAGAIGRAGLLLKAMVDV